MVHRANLQDSNIKRSFQFGIRCRDAAVAEAKDFENTDYNALVIQPEVLVSAKGKSVSKNKCVSHVFMS